MIWSFFSHKNKNLILLFFSNLSLIKLFNIEKDCHLETEPEYTQRIWSSDKSNEFEILDDWFKLKLLSKWEEYVHGITVWFDKE